MTARRGSAAPGLRIVAGKWSGRRILAAPGSRPTKEQVREACLSRLQGVISGARVLDLYCGGGAFGIEALSRGAAGAWFVDTDQRALAVVRQNLESVGAESRSYRLARRRLPQQGLPESWPQRFDVVVADPPYGEASLVAVMALLLAHAEPGGTVLLEHAVRDRESPVLLEPGRWRRWSDDAPDQRRYGVTLVTALRRSTCVRPARDEDPGGEPRDES